MHSIIVGVGLCTDTGETNLTQAGPFEEKKASLGTKEMCEQKCEQKADSRGSRGTYEGLNYIRHVETSTEQAGL